MHSIAFLYLDYSTVCFLDSYQPAYIMAADKVLTDLAKKYIETLPAVSDIRILHLFAIDCSFLFLFFIYDEEYC
jgi:hypothetical protein